MKCLLCNDGGTAWMFEFVGVKTLKIFGITEKDIRDVVELSLIHI